MPKVGESIAGRISYYLRPGIHGVLDYDWEKYLGFLDARL
jgi:hypothetical protein